MTIPFGWRFPRLRLTAGCSMALHAAVAIVIAIGIGCPTAATGADFTLISKSELKEMLGSGSLTIVDVRSAAAWKSSGKKITGAIRKNPSNTSEWAEALPNEARVVLYCS